MGRRGPAPKPTALRLLHGDQPKRINLAEPRPRDMAPDMPGWLSPMAAEEWRRVVPDLVTMGTAKAVDASGLAAYCEAVARLRAASVLVAQTGPLIVGRDGLAHKNPAVQQARDASYEVRAWAREFGLTPSARSAVRVDQGHGGLAPLAAERLLS